MKKLALLLALCMLPLGLLASCNGTENVTSSQPTVSTESETISQEESIVKTPDPTAGEAWNDLYADEGAGLTGPDSIYDLSVYENGNEADKVVAPGANTDVRYLFAGETATRAVVPAEGYMLTLPGVAEADFSLGKFRSQYKTENYCLTVTYEDQNPYGDNQNGYDLYMREWLVEQIDDLNFLSKNQIMRTRAVQEVVVGDYTVKTYCMKINLGAKIRFPFYQIAIIRPTASYEYFYLFVMKSDAKMLDEFDAMIASFAEIDRVGVPANGFASYEVKANPNWNAETAAYYESLMNRTDVGFGAFHQGNDDTYTNWLWGEEAINATPDVYMTYLHVGWYDNLSGPEEVMERAAKHAGGDGKNGKPIFNLTYQFTVTNNATGGVYTPMFDILRGKLDDHFRNLARALKEYGKPVLFRLNNEMNTDWTDYCGMMTLIDPDIFQMTWRHMYNIFEEEGVDNCIWIFNPISTSCPYSNWGEAMCYMPGADYVQMLGITHYQMNNGTNGAAPASFKAMYTETANKMLPYFENHPWIIGEFACGAGGEAFYDWGKNGYIFADPARNAKLQEQWVKGMLECFRNNQKPENAFCKNIKLAIWFSCNDYADADGDGQYDEVTNYLKLDENTMGAIKALGDYIRETK